MKCQLILYEKKKKEKLEYRLLQILLGALRVKTYNQPCELCYQHRPR